jgi:transglutaminase-like putative cysteine protease
MLKWQLFQVLPASSTDAIANYINANFKTETDKIRAVFYWTASNISYDVPGMFDLNVNETVPEKIAKTLKKRKGVCAHYAVVLMILLKREFSLIL